MNIYLRELRANAKSLFFWILGLVMVIAAGIGKFSGAGNTDQSINAIMEAMPEIVLVIFGMNGLNLDTVEGYYGVISFMVLIMTAVHGGMLGAGIISKEERDRTSEFLFVKPVSRPRIITSKIFAALTNVVALNLISLIISFIMVKTVDQNTDLSLTMVSVALGTLLIQLLFMFLGTCLASVIKKSDKASGISATAVLVGYIIYVLSDLDEKLRFFKVLSPFKYFEPKNIINGEGFEFIYIAILLALTAMFIAATYIPFKKRDLNA